MYNKLNDFLKHVASRTKPNISNERLAALTEERVLVNDLILKNSTIYGANTLTGHRDIERVDVKNFTDHDLEILCSHSIGGDKYYSNYSVACITYWKLYTWYAGNSGVSRELLEKVSVSIEKDNIDLKIPKYCSYSCGDVIPGAHWSKEMLNKFDSDTRNCIKPGDIMAMINGDYISMGYAISLIKNIRTAWLYYIELLIVVSNVSNSNNSNLYFNGFSKEDWVCKTLDIIKSNIRVKNDKTFQDPVSIRSIPEQITLLCYCIDSYIKEIEGNIGKPSGNPLFDINYEGSISQASFFNPKLTVLTESLIEAFLYVAWGLVNGVKHILSGNIEGIPKDGACKVSSLGLIQYPKLMMAKLERMRQRYGRRIFSSGSQTSNGVEDIWCSSEIVLEELEDILEDFIEICVLESEVFDYLQKNLEIEIASQLVKSLNSKTGRKERISNATNYVNNFGISDLKQIFPIQFSDDCKITRQV